MTKTVRKSFTEEQNCHGDNRIRLLKFFLQMTRVQGGYIACMAKINKKKIILEEKITVWYGGCESKNVHGVSKMRLIGGDNNSRRNVLAKSGLSTIPAILPE